MSCKGLLKEDCNKFESCKYVNGAKRKYCRTKKNRKRQSKKPISNKPMSSFKKTIVSEPEYMAILNYEFRDKPFAAFDLDDTIIKTKSGKKFPRDREDWVFAYDNTKDILQKLDQTYNIIIITNQKRLKKYELRDDFIEKIDAIVRALDIPINIYISTSEGYYRKPFTGLWVFIKSHPKSKSKKSFYCGDAAGREGNVGRKGDFAATDWMFAHNLKIKFMTPENIFLRDKTQITHDLPDYLAKYVGTNRKIKLEKSKKMMVLMCGYPGSGKSTIAKSLDFKIASNDLLGSKSKVKKYVNECIQSDQNIVIDNVNHTKKNREEFIKIAKKHGYSVTIIYVDNDINFCYYMNQLRTELSQGSKKLVPKIAYYTIKKRFEIPQASECDHLVILSNKVKSYEYLFPGLN